MLLISESAVERLNKARFIGGGGGDIGVGATAGGTTNTSPPDDYLARLETLHSAIYETGLSYASPDAAHQKVMIGSHTHSGVVPIQSFLDKTENPTETPEEREKRIRKQVQVGPEFYVQLADIEFQLGLLDKCRDHVARAESWIHNWHERVTRAPRADKIDVAAWLASRPAPQKTIPLSSNRQIASETMEILGIHPRFVSVES
jgi:hypothetical protein